MAAGKLSFRIGEFDGRHVGVFGGIAAVDAFDVLFNFLGEVDESGSFGVEELVPGDELHFEFGFGLVYGLGGGYQSLVVGGEGGQLKVVFVGCVGGNGLQEADEVSEGLGLLGVGLAGGGNGVFGFAVGVWISGCWDLGV